MSTYTLTAHLGRDNKTTTIEADSQLDALFQSVKHVMWKGSVEDGGPWAHGIVILSDSDGYPIHTIDAAR